MAAQHLPRTAEPRPDLGVLIEAGTITAILPANATPPARRHPLPPECLLAPGLIDIQCERRRRPAIQ